MHRLLKPFINWRSVLITSVASASTCEAQTSKESKLKEEACFKRGTLIVKYGGSAITQKNKLETLKRDILIASAGDIKFAYDSEKWNRIVLVHGAGSFGHFQAKQYALKNGRGSDDDMENNNSSDCWKTGLSLTRQSVLKLNAEVLAAHITAGLPAVAISPFPSTVTGRILDSPLSPINPRGSVVVQPGALADVLGVAQKGLLPVVHGDVVLDASQTCAVLGGDHIIAWLCRKINEDCVVTHKDSATRDNKSISNSNIKSSNDESASVGRECVRVVFLTDVAGVYDRAPHLPGAALLRHIAVHADGTTDTVASTETAAHDVTGGIEAKLQAAIGMAMLGPHVEVYVVKAGSPSARQALCGEAPESGTLIRLRSLIP